ncbi:hypothetical protein C7974DRAFT_456526 [Boeremia exigua]|uniref:uncharacterized protein n=1 Tax=Boeremia exigua TaxID=749465 RepID=UPI001E8E4D37|nr:uncharacterized protein C7974DRAFT_456526 [Boeremia exigua]KAH6621813.1 hypothetical protein C7974DRAFT_456526 [Boeremia exigua]
MWKKWARVSNWTDLVCYTLNKQYKWEAIPVSLNFSPEIRAWYRCDPSTWAKDAKAGFEGKWESASKRSLTADEKAWKTEAFGRNGYATAAKVKFPRSQGSPGTAGASTGSGPYGAYG